MLFRCKFLLCPRLRHRRLGKLLGPKNAVRSGITVAYESNRFIGGTVKKGKQATKRKFVEPTLKKEASLVDVTLTGSGDQIVIRD